MAEVAKQVVLGVLNQGYKVKFISFGNPIGQDGKLNTRMEEAVFHILGTQKTATINFFLESEKDPSARNSKRILVSNLARQAQLTNDAPDLNYLIHVEGMKRQEAEKRITDGYDKTLNSLVGKEFTLWYTQSTSNGRTYVNYIPYEPTVTETDDSDGFDGFKQDKKEVKA